MFIIQTVEYWYLLQEVAFAQTLLNNTLVVQQTHLPTVLTVIVSLTLGSSSARCVLYGRTDMRVGEVRETGPTERHGRKADVKDENSIRGVKSSVTSFSIIYSTTCFIWLLRGVLQL